jgi:hypothetical protein
MRMHYAVQILGWLGLGLLWIVCERLSKLSRAFPTPERASAAVLGRSGTRETGFLRGRGFPAPNLPIEEQAPSALPDFAWMLALGRSLLGDWP